MSCGRTLVQRHGLHTDHPVGLDRGPVLVENSFGKACGLIWFDLFDTSLWFLPYLNTELKKSLYHFSSAFHSCIPDLFQWMNFCLEVCWTPPSVSSHICCKQTPLLKIGPTKGVAKWVYVKIFLCSSVLIPLSGMETGERINHKCFYYCKWTFAVIYTSL